MAEKQRESLLRSSISINSIRRTASQFTKSLQRSNTIAREIVQSTKQRNLFERSMIAKDNEYFRKRRENIRRKEREDELEASSVTGVTKREGSVTAKSTKGFLGRILDFFGIILIGWFVNRLPGILKAIGNVINLIKRATGFLTGFIDGVRDFLSGISDGIKAAVDAFPKFDFSTQKNETDKVLKDTEEKTTRLFQDVFFATRESENSFNEIYKDNPDLDPNTGELIYPEEFEKQLRGDGEGEGENEQEGEENISNEIKSAVGVDIGGESNVEGVNTTVGEEEIKLVDDETNKKIEEAVDKFSTTGKKIGDVGVDDQTKELGKNIEATTSGMGGGSGESGGGGQQVADANAKSQNIDETNNKSKVDDKDEEIQDDEIVSEKGVPIKNKRGRIIGYKKVEPAQVSKNITREPYTGDNERRLAFEKKKKDIKNVDAFGGTGKPVTVTTLDGKTVTVNPGEPGYFDAFRGIVPISKQRNDLVMTNKSDRPTIIFSDVGSSSSGSSTMSSSGGSTDIQDFKKSDNTMNKIQTLILET